MEKKQRIRWELAHAGRKYTRGSSSDYDAVARIARAYDMSTGGGPLRTLALGYSKAKYW